jgi:hypothetical protein
MSNIFKSNSRFSVLVDDIPPQNNNFKKDKEEKNERFNSFKSERESPFRERYRKQEEREKEQIKEESLKIENFPDLLVVSNKKEFMKDIKKVSYIEKLQKEDDIKKYIDADLENLKPGWILLKSDPLTRRTIIKHHPEINIIEKKKEKTEREIAMDVLNVLVELHEKRTREYIDNFGYDEWERMFKFPDWIEREAYLEQMENETNDSEYEYEYEDEDEYED